MPSLCDGERADVPAEHGAPMREETAAPPSSRFTRWAPGSVAATVALVSVLGACGSSATTENTVHFDAGARPDALHDTGDNAMVQPGTDASNDTHAVTPSDGGHGADTGSATPDGGAPMRNASCTPTSSQNGNAVNSSYGRLDGTLVYVVDVGTDSQCNGDYSHVHLQLEVSGAVYDVAVDIGKSGDEVGIFQESITVPGGVWSEGWHGSDALAYPSLGLHSTQFPLMAPDAIGTEVESLLAGVSKVSIFCKGYSQGNGCHDVHYEDGYNDGAIVLDPTAATSETLFFRFSDQSF
jgi:hypothetical protein